MCILKMFCWSMLFKMVNKISRNITLLWMLTHTGLVMPYGDINLGQHWPRQCLVAWWHQAITWTNGYCGACMRPISQEILMISIHFQSEMSVKITLLTLLPHLPGANELILWLPSSSGEMEYLHMAWCCHMLPEIMVIISPMAWPVAWSVALADAELSSPI